MLRVLVVDDEENLRLVLQTLLRKHGYEVEAVESAEAALDRFDAVSPDFVLADVRMPGMSGLELTEALVSRPGAPTIIVMSAYGSVELALSAMKAGAYDYISKPFKPDEVLLTLRKAEEREHLKRENAKLREQVAGRAPFEEMVGQSEALARVFKVVDKAAAFDTTVLIEGESGTGKELVARALHRRGPRRDGPFVAVNCGAIPEALLESELFGHKRGAFTDARSDKVGLFETADGGTLFLDEIGELPLGVQVKLLRVLQEGSFRRLGETKDRSSDIRLVAATMKNLKEEVTEGRFREDLFYRLHVLRIEVPPLRERRDDIPLLVDHFLERVNGRLGTQIEGMESGALRRLMSHAWPGNVRELENVVERSVVLAEGTRLTVEDLPDELQDMHPVQQVLSGGDLSVKKAIRRIEEALIRRALDETGGNRTRAAKLLELSHRALLYKMKDYGVS
jgi:two-component system response regulator AtoC